MIKSQTKFEFQFRCDKIKIQTFIKNQHIIRSSHDIDNFENENEKFKIAKKKKNINKINSNHESIKSKNIKMYR